MKNKKYDLFSCTIYFISFVFGTLFLFLLFRKLKLKIRIPFCPKQNATLLWHDSVQLFLERRLAYLHILDFLNNYPILKRKIKKNREHTGINLFPFLSTLLSKMFHGIQYSCRFKLINVNTEQPWKNNKKSRCTKQHCY